MTAVGPSISDEVFVGQNLYKAGNSVPYRLRLREVWTRAHAALGTGGKTLGAAAAAGLAPSAGMKELLVRAETATTADVHETFIQPVDPLPCRRGALLVLDSSGVAMIGGTIGAHDTARRYHSGSVVCPGLALLAQESLCAFAPQRLTCLFYSFGKMPASHISTCVYSAAEQENHATQIHVGNHRLGPSSAVWM